MAQPHPLPTPPVQPAWDIAYTRMTQCVRPRLEACALDLARRFLAIGLGSDTQVRQTPRGLSTFLAIVGPIGLICIVDMTLVDGMAVGRGPCAMLDIRVLDACGDVVAHGLAHGDVGRPFRETTTADALKSQDLDRAATAVYVTTLGHFDLLRPSARAA